MKGNKGYVYFDKKRNGWFARVTFTDERGKRRDIKRKVENKTEGYKLLKTTIEIYECSGTKGIDAEKITINFLCDYYEERYCKPPKYVNGRKVEGLRSFVQVKGYLNVFREYFGGMKLKSLTYEDLRSFRNHRLSTPTHQSSQRSIATVNRELAYLRRILTIAERNDWINKNLFKRGDALIHCSDEVKRERILTSEECQRLINACTDRRAHIRPIVIAALDTGCRLGELLKMCWSDIDFDSGIIIIRAFNTKTMRKREVAITSRLRAELENLWQSFPQDETDIVFGVSEIRKGFKSACSEAELTDLRFHDLRHCHASKLDELGFSVPEIANQLGHTQIQTTMRYVNRNKTSIRKVATLLDSVFASEITSSNSESSELIN